MGQPTDELIQRLAASVGPVRRLPHPAASALAWLGIAVPYGVLVALALGPRTDLTTVLSDSGFVFSALGGVVAAGSAAVAAFATAVPGFDPWRRAGLMLVPLGWFAWFAGGAFVAGAANPAEVAGWDCLASLLVFAGVPVIAMAILLRHGAPLAPGRALLYGALAAGALADVGARICHRSASEAHLVWHVLAVMILVLAATRVASVVLRWPSRRDLPPSPA